MKRALVLFSGGQDSSTCLAWALKHYDYVETVGFDYGQRHHVELRARHRLREAFKTGFQDWARRLGSDHVLDLHAFGALSETALTQPLKINWEKQGLPNTFVPGRNLVFLVYAAALGYRRGLTHLVGGMGEADYSGYPDCRHATMKAQEQALQLGLDSPVKIETPLMFLDKAGIWSLTYELGGSSLVELFLEETRTCYEGVEDTRHAWGYGCGTCPACELRARGFETWQSHK